MTVKDALAWAYGKLKKTSSSPHLDGEVLLSFVLNKPKEYLFANPGKRLSRRKISKYRNLIGKRAVYQPVAYLVGHKEFFGLDFKITPDVLIPRPDTELLVELGLKRIMGHASRTTNVIDIGTGSGNIIVSLVKSLDSPLARGGWPKAGKGLKFFALDSSLKALRVARLNARRHSVLNKIKFLRGSLLSPFFENWKLKIRNCLVLANLPYLTKKQLNNKTIKREPRVALYGGPDGLKHFRELFNQLSRRCEEERRSNPKKIAARPWSARNDRYNITLLLEHDPSQKQKLTKLARFYFPKARISFLRDLAGNDRVLEIKINC